VALLIGYVALFANEDFNACGSLGPLYIIFLFFVSVNSNSFDDSIAFFYLFLFRVEYASDQEWFKYMVFAAINLGVQLIAVTVVLYLLIKAIDDRSIECIDQHRSHFVFLTVAVCINAVLVIVKAVALAILQLQLFKGTKNYFYYKEEPDINVKM